MVTERGEPSVESVSGLLFGAVADRYERYRLGYPDELFAAVLRYAGRPIRVALEVGAGTGKAARLLASRGVGVTALEPDAEMADLPARTTQGLPVEPVVVTFERFRTDRRFDLVYAAAAWHWTDPRTRLPAGEDDDTELDLITLTVSRTSTGHHQRNRAAFGLLIDRGATKTRRLSLKEIAA